MPLENSGRDIDKLAVRSCVPVRAEARTHRAPSTEWRSSRFLRTFGDCPPRERALEVAVFGEPAKRDVECGAPVLLVAVPNLSEDAASRGLVDEPRRSSVRMSDDRAHRLATMRSISRSPSSRLWPTPTITSCGRSLRTAAPASSTAI